MASTVEDEKLLKVVETQPKIREQKKLDHEFTCDIKQEEIEVKLYKRRWLMLALYVTYMLCNSSQWLQYTIISDIIQKYYNVSEFHVNLTSLIMMIFYIPLALPAAYIMDRISLRWTAVVGAGGTCAGCWLKVAAAAPQRYGVTLAAQALVALAQVFMLSVPQKLSSAWFGEREVSSACSIGVFGFQMGIVVGFFLPPMLVRDHADPELVGHDLHVMFLSFACVTTVVTILVLIYFEGAPPKPPTISQAQALKSATRTPYFPTLRRLFSQRSICAMFLLTGVNNGCFNGLSTLLSSIFLKYFPGQHEDAGRVGVTMVICGMTASVVYGVVLDRTKQFKPLLLAIYFMSAASVLGLTFALEQRSLLVVYVAAGIVGTFLCGFTAVSFDVATELTYPESELIVGTIMNASSLLFTVVCTLAVGWLSHAWGVFCGNLALAGVLAAGAAVLLPVPFRLRRSVKARGVAGDTHD